MRKSSERTLFSFGLTIAQCQSGYQGKIKAGSRASLKNRARRFVRVN